MQPTDFRAIVIKTLRTIGKIMVGILAGTGALLLVAIEWHIGTVDADAAISIGALTLAFAYCLNLAANLHTEHIRRECQRK